jgi:hypothetical protein
MALSCGASEKYSVPSSQECPFVALLAVTAEGTPPKPSHSSRAPALGSRCIEPRGNRRGLDSDQAADTTGTSVFVQVQLLSACPSSLPLVSECFLPLPAYIFPLNKPLSTLSTLRHWTGPLLLTHTGSNSITSPVPPSFDHRPLPNTTIQSVHGQQTFH